LSFLLLLISTLNKIGEKDRTVSAWKQGWGGEGGDEGQGGEMAQTMYAHMNI
jgi:hypothetical protein